jgi:DNA-binding transcriptional ArsR family regulator
LELNESKLIENEVTLRNLRLTKEVVETRRSMVRWLALSLGIINPGETRLSALGVLDAMLYFQFTKRQDPSVEELSDYIGKTWGGLNEKTLRYHLLQLKNANIITHSKGRYSFVRSENSEPYDELAWIDNYFSSELAPIRDKVSTVIRELKGR